MLKESYLLDILDEDGFVIIGNYLFYLDFNNKMVAVSSDLNLKDAIKQEDFSSESIRLFRFEDDVIGLIEIGSSSTIDKGNFNSRIESHFVIAPTLGSGCSWDKCDNNGTIEQDQFDPITLTEYRLEAKHVYQAAGIYFRLMSESKHMKRGGNLTYTSEPTNNAIRYDYWFESKKSSIGIRSGHSEKYSFISDQDIFFYESSRGLERFRLDSQFEVFIGGSHGSGSLGWWLFNLQRISKGI